MYIMFSFHESAFRLPIKIKELNMHLAITKLSAIIYYNIIMIHMQSHKLLSLTISTAIYIIIIANIIKFRREKLHKSIKGE